MSPDSYGPAEEAPRRLDRKVLLAIVLVLAFIVFLGVISVISTISSNRQITYERQSPNAWIDAPADVQVVSLATIVDTYKTNEVRAEEIYTGQEIVVVGQVYRVNTSVFGSAYVSIVEDASKTNIFTVNCYFDSTDGLASLNAGDTVAILGVPKGDWLSEVNFHNCEIVGRK